jgi:uncharacterized protein YcaQ
MCRLAFVQADPIRCPARAQDLILRHRAKNYRAGDLERQYPELDLEECYLYAYGFLSPKLWRAVHPRKDDKLSKEQQLVLALIEDHGPMTPRMLEIHVGGERRKNYWGGYSRSAKMVLESLHSRGALRVARRDNGLRVYGIAAPFEQGLSNEERFEAILLGALQSMGATTRSFLLKELGHFKNLVAHRADRNRCLQGLVDRALVRVDQVGAVEYLSIADEKVGRRRLDCVRILAPFDPIVRDRARFEHLFGWAYRFEAYVPKAKRKLGYYAMPVLWRDEVVGWVNAAVAKDRLQVEFGYVNGRPDERAYKDAAEAEVACMAAFLGVEDWSIRL